MILAYVIGVDIGTTSTKSIVFDLHGEILGQYLVDYPLYTPEPGAAEHNPDEVFDAVTKTIAQSIHKAGIDPRHIRCVSFSSAMHTLIGVDNHGKPLTGCLSFADTRSFTHTQHIREYLNGHDIYLRTGTPLHPMAPLSKLRWLRSERGDIFNRVYKFISIKEYVLARLFNQYVVDYSIASATGLFNLQQLAWDQEALRVAGVKEEQLSTPQPPTHMLIGLDRAWADILNLPVDVPFVIGSSDGVLSNIGLGAVRPGVMAATIGTSGAVRRMVHHPMIDLEGRLFCYALTEDRWVIGGPVNNGGLAFRWVRDELGEAEVATAKRLGKDLYEVLTEVAERVLPGSEGLIFLPFLTGERAPYWNANARGVFFGLSLNHRKEHMIRSVLEGVIYSMYSVALALESLAGEAKEIRASGGFSRSPLWRQILADVFGNDVTIPVHYESSCLGAAILGMWALGEIDSFEEAQDLAGAVHRHRPIVENVNTYRKLMAIYRRVYDHLLEEFEAIAELQRSVGRHGTN